MERIRHLAKQISVCAIAMAFVGLARYADAGVPQETEGRANPAAYRPNLGSGNTASQNEQQEAQPGHQAPPERRDANTTGSAENNGSNNPPNTQATQSIAPIQSGTRQTQLNDSIAASGAEGQWQRQGQPNNAAPQDTIPENITKVTKTSSALPNDAGQVWREYDILPYTSQVENNEQPQQAIIDWILRQTGKEMWFSQPLGFISATREKLIVYHTPEIHTEILKLVDRFVYTRGQKNTAILNLVTVSNPAWRESVYSVLQPVDVHSPGVEAWLLTKENAALLYSQLSQRSDFKNHSSGAITLANGQEFKLDKRAPVQFVRSLRWTPGQGSGYQPLMTQMQEGYSLSLSFLDSLDGKAIEAAITCEVDQVERLTGIRVPVPSLAAAPSGFGLGNNNTETINLQIPQIVSWRLQERIRWPVDHVLVMSCGVVADPNPGSPKPLGGLLDRKSNRADALLFIDFRGPENPRTARTPAAPQNLAPLKQN
ncbi:MAG: hypothetical protein R3C03_07570 [Pirellulaceae bacterium]